MMMKLVKKDLLESQFSGSLDVEGEEHDVIIAEMLRHELWAQKRISSHMLVRKVFSRCQGEFELAEIKRVFKELESRRDITTASGVSTITPLRIVELGKGNFLLHTSVPTRILNGLLTDGLYVAPALSRYLQAEGSEEADFRNWLSENGGKILTPGQWSELVNEKAAGSDFLASQNVRLAEEGKEGLYSEVELDQWRGYCPDADEEFQSRKWKSYTKASQNDCYLWKANIEGKWRSFWTEGQAPPQGQSIRLSTDDDKIAMFSLDKDADSVLTFPYTLEGRLIKFELPAFVSFACYRYLTTVSDSLEKEFGKTVFYIHEDFWDDVSAEVVRHLGVRILKVNN